AVPITGRLPPSARLPAVHNLALVAERVRPERRLLRLDQVLPLGEQLVVGVDHAAAERPAGQVGPRLLVLAVHAGHPPCLVCWYVHAPAATPASRSRAIICPVRRSSR